MHPAPTQIGQTWRKSTYSLNNGACVEVGVSEKNIVVRDTKALVGPAISYTQNQWNSFLAEAKRNRRSRA